MAVEIFTGRGQGSVFFRFPTQLNERRKRWMQVVRRKDWQPTKHAWICGDHFVSGESIVGTVTRKYYDSYFLIGKPVDQSKNVDYVQVSSVTTNSSTRVRHKAESVRTGLIDGECWLKLRQWTRRMRDKQKSMRRRVRRQLQKVCYYSSSPAGLMHKHKHPLQSEMLRQCSLHCVPPRQHSSIFQ